MNNECRGEIARLIRKTRPDMAPDPMMVLAKWIYLDAAKICREAGMDDLAQKMIDRTVIKKNEIPQA